MEDYYGGVVCADMYGDVARGVVLGVVLAMAANPTERPGRKRAWILEKAGFQVLAIDPRDTGSPVALCQWTSERRLDESSL
jgi:hypothetical protein